MKSLSKSISFVVLLAGLVALPSTWASADEDFHDLRLTLGGTSLFVRDASLDPFSKNDVVAFSRVMVEWELGLNLLVGLGYQSGSLNESVFDRVRSELVLQDIPVSLRYRYRVMPWLEPFARLEVGPTFTTMTLEMSTSGQKPVDQWLPGVMGKASLGFELLIPRTFFRKSGGENGGFTVGGAFEAGYMYRTPGEFDSLNVDGVKNNDDFSRQLPQGKVNAGTLEASGAFMTFDLVVHF